MFEILSFYGIPQKFINAIRLFYVDTKASVQTPDSETSSFPIIAGILQGDTLAPFVVDYIMRVSVHKIHSSGFQLERRRGPRNPATFLTDTDFADDIALISSHISDLGLFTSSPKNKHKNRVFWKLLHAGNDVNWRYAIWLV